jgi:uncharacterized repeat protein (TIGR02543 family)/LPXTG-motif cell wall-anchored protein
VSFDSQQGSAVDPVTVDYWSAVAKPADPTRDGYTFAGWFTQATGGTLWDFGSPVTADITLYAHWNAVPELAATGVDVTGWSLAGLGLLLLGGAAVALSRTRRRLWAR